MNTDANLHIPDIEKELGKLSKQQNADKQTRACLFTLIIYSSVAPRTQYLEDVVDAILEKFPCRIIFIQELDKESDYLNVNVSNITSGKNDSPVVCDRINIEASKSMLSRIPFLVLPRIVSDLPVYLLWGQNPFEDKEVFPHLQHYASRVLFDSEFSDNLDVFCQEMLENLNSLKMDVMDVNWAFLSNWRDVISQIFHSKEQLEQLKDCKSINISYNHAAGDLQHPAIRAIYLQGWLASRLNWEFVDYETIDNSHVISYKSRIYPVIITLSPCSVPDIPAGALSSIDIKTHSKYAYSIKRNEKLSQAIVQVSTPQQCDVPFILPLPNVHRGLNFMKEIFFYKLSDHYRDMLAIIAKISKK